MSDDNIAIISFFGVVVGLPILLAIVAVASEQWRKVRIAEQNAVLKKEMIERGFTAHEIVTVINAGKQEASKIAGKTPHPAGCP